MLELKHLSKSYPGKRHALKDLSSPFPGEIVGLLGENGAGKTTLLKCILGLHRFQGKSSWTTALTRKDYAKLSFATSEHSFFPALSAQAHRDFTPGISPFRQARYDGLMDFFQLPRHKAAGRLSTGQQNQLEVILALSQGADYILMDEPFAGNDLFNREDFYKVLVGILEPQETLLLSTHLLEETAPFLSRALLLRQGTLVADLDPLALEETGADLLSYVKRAYHYQADRVSRALTQLTNGKEPLP
ncbi:MAG: ATP-binding cassette domain-containing protein [Evtepia gabavorous]